MNFTALIYSMKNDVSKVLDSDEDTDQVIIYSFLIFSATTRK